jgi:hypothetical protein
MEDRKWKEAAQLSRGLARLSQKASKGFIYDLTFEASF